MSGEMVTKKTWEQFRATGLLWWVNRILHTFGWAIVFEYSDIEQTKITEVYPARTIFRGFTEEIEEDGFKKVTDYLRYHIKELHGEAFEEESDGSS